MAVKGQIEHQLTVKQITDEQQLQVIEQSGIDAGRRREAAG